jgi:hypothetical protein
MCKLSHASGTPPRGANRTSEQESTVIKEVKQFAVKAILDIEK